MSKIKEKKTDIINRGSGIPSEDAVQAFLMYSMQYSFIATTIY